MKKYLLICLIAVSGIATAQNTNNDTLHSILNRVSDSIVGSKGAWQFQIEDRLLVCLTDENNNRMRIISPITELSNLSEEDLLNSLLANFHTALDVKYAISDNILWSVFTHPLKELTEHQFEDAIVQVYNAAETYGTSYNSTTLSFPGVNSGQPSRREENTKPIEKLQKG